MELLLKRIAGEDELPERRLIIDIDNPISIGRASKTETKQLIPAVTNCWIRNPVISRTHAELTLQPSGIVSVKPPNSSQLETDQVAMQNPAVVFIQDKKSSHGTYVNGQNIQNIKHPLQDKDEIRFGSEVMRGEGQPAPFQLSLLIRCTDFSTETFRPPVFSFQIGHSQPPPLTKAVDTTIIDTTSTGITITVPDDSGAESEGEEDVAELEQASSVPLLSSENTGMRCVMTKMQGGWLKGYTGSSFLGSQANPWTIDEADMVPNSDPVRDTANEEDDDASSDSNISLQHDEDLEESRLDTEEDEDPLVVFDDDEESELEDHDSEGIAESPIYTPKSPQYVPAETDSLASGYTPPQFGTDTGYWDAPFAFGSFPSYSRANDSMFNNPPPPWPMQDAQQSTLIPGVFSKADRHAESSAPQHSANAGTETAPLKPTTTNTRDLLDLNRRAYNKTDMSINSLINPSPGKESSTTSTKRKADELDLEEEVDKTGLGAEASFSISNTVEIESDKLPQTPESLNKELIETPAFETVVPTTVTILASVAVEPPRKKQKLRTMVAKAAIFGAGVMVGSAGMLGGLMSLPDGFFQS